jgi:hypothetical protein
MAFEAFIPKVVSLDGDDVIFEGISYRRSLTVKKTVSGVETPVNMTEYDAVAPVIVFKDKATEDGGVTTGCPTGVCAWTDAPGGILQLDVTAAATNSLTGSGTAQKFTGIFEITVLHDTEEDTTGIKKKALIYRGSWSVTKTASAV